VAKKIFFILLYLPAFFSSAQQQDAVVWASLNVEKKINKHFSGTFFNQYILNQNLSELGLYFYDAGITYKYNSNFSAALNARFSNARNLDNFYEQRHMLYADIAYAKGFGKFGVTARTRLQRQYYNGLFDGESVREPKTFSRNKVTLRYRYNWYWSFYAAEEIFYRTEKNEISVWRTSAGIYYQFNLKNKIEVSYAVQQQDNTENPRTDFITGINYYYRF
jgi:hypothetical protein